MSEELSAEGLGITFAAVRQRLYRGIIPMPRRRQFTPKLIVVMDPPLSLVRDGGARTVRPYKSRRSPTTSLATSTQTPKRTAKS